MNKCGKGFKVLMLLASIIVLITSLSGCGTDDSQFLGVWETPKSFRTSPKGTWGPGELEFFKDGTLLYTVSNSAGPKMFEGTYSTLDETRVKLTIKGPVVYIYSFIDNDLELYYTVGDETHVLTRYGEAKSVEQDEQKESESLDIDFENSGIDSSILAPAYVEGKWGYIDVTGSLVIQPRFDNAMTFCDGLALIEEHDHYGYINKNGRVVIPAQFDKAGDVHGLDFSWKHFNEGLAIVQFQDKYGYIGKNGKLAIEQLFDCHSGNYLFGLLPSDGLISFQEDGKYGYMDKTGNIVIRPIYEYGGLFSNGYVGVGLDGKAGVINKNGDTVIDFIYDRTSCIFVNNRNIIIAAKGDKQGLIDITGEEIIGFDYNGIRYESEDVTSWIVQLNNKWGVINTSGEVILSPEYNDIIRLGDSDDFWAVQIDGSWGIINRDGTYKHEPVLRMGEYYQVIDNNRIPVGINQKWGFIDSEGDMIIEPRFEDTLGFSNGLAAVEVDGKWGFINTEGEVIIEPQFGGVRNFNEEL